MDLVQPQGLALPFARAPEGAQLVCEVVVGQRPDGSYALEQRLPSGTPLDMNNPSHMFGLFVVQNAQQIMTMAMQAGRQAIEQTNEIIAANSLRGD